MPSSKGRVVRKGGVVAFVEPRAFKKIPKIDGLTLLLAFLFLAGRCCTHNNQTWLSCCWSMVSVAMISGGDIAQKWDRQWLFCSRFLKIMGIEEALVWPKTHRLFHADDSTLLLAVRLSTFVGASICSEIAEFPPVGQKPK